MKIAIILGFGIVALVSWRSLRGMDQGRGLFGLIVVLGLLGMMAFVLLSDAAGWLADEMLDSAQYQN